MSAELATRAPDRVTRLRTRVLRRPSRAVAVQVLGPATILGGLVWAVLQPHRIVFFERDGKGVYDYLAQPPLLVVLVGLFFTVFIAPGLVEDLERDERGTEG